ncbi:probable basic-leucine zipper transcription factor J [Hylaeus anthracinus]|uniref:probable basic-leucine zipper transcription factor J n=1 Tax=Hylaeus anthracinus TaxID=313031 RepID=UPI0023B98146|nr:probable basic-leucine zipper transcription factor J [Hylaeus anthracinus]
MSDECDSLKCQRSSLAVNLSCCSNLVDSGNGSLRQIDAGYNDNTPTTSKGGKYGHSKSKQRSILLENMSANDEILNRDCERLKEAILTKTKQVFDIQNELSVKTRIILESKFSISNNDCMYNAANSKVSTISNISDRIEHKDTQNSINQFIGSTPKDMCNNKDIKDLRKQHKLKRRRLFNGSRHLNDTNMCNNNVNGNSNSPILCSSLSKDRSYRSSIVLAGSNKRPNTLNLSHSVACKNPSASISSISEDDSIFMAVPIGCSTMINDQILDPETEECSQTESELSPSNSHTNKNVCPMEIAHFQGGIISNDKQQSSLQATVEVSEPSNQICKGLEKSSLINNIYEQSTKVHYNDQSIQAIPSNSADTIRTSLNVNTSIDINNKYHRRKQRKYNKNSRDRQEKGKYSSVSEEVQESINNNCTSLQMNTSLDTSNKLCLQENNNKRKLSVSNDVVSKNTDAEENLTTTSNMHKTQDKIVNKTRDNHSYVEATPYPTLLKPQLRQNTVAHSLNSNFHNDENAECRNPRQSIILNDSSSCETHRSKLQTSVLIQESMDGSELKKDQNTTNATVLAGKRKCKKLLPLRECSQLLSFSPMEHEHLPPVYPMHTKRRKKKKKQHIKNKVNSKSNENNIKFIERQSSEQLLLEDDDNCIFPNKKKPSKKTRKIISKKMTVKKIVEEDILKKLEEERENKIKPRIGTLSSNSLNDFQADKGLTSTSSSKRKTQKISIVATGLSNDDKNIIKSVVKSLGHAKLEARVTKRTTHVVTTGVRTINLLHGIIRGCWLVKFEWILKSLENNAWLDPEEYEMAHFSKAVLENRKDRQLFGTSYVPELFTACGCIYVEKDTKPPYDAMKDLIKTAGGRLTDDPETAKIVIGTKGLKESWVLDCITTGELQPYNQYQRHQINSNTQKSKYK